MWPSFGLDPVCRLPATQTENFQTLTLLHVDELVVGPGDEEAHAAGLVSEGEHVDVIKEADKLGLVQGLEVDRVELS